VARFSFVLFAGWIALSQCTNAQTSRPTTPDLPQQKKPWFDKQMRIELSLVAASLAADSYTTISNGGPSAHEMNPVARHFGGDHMTNEAGLAIYSSASLLATVSGNVLLRNHPKLRHVLNWSIIGLEVEAASHNATLHHSR
jgi:hypothetical protein